jgi:predicted ATPase
MRNPAIFVVITGGPSVGKTTIISLLQQRGHHVVAEQATQIIKEGQVFPWVDRSAFQKEVLRRQLMVESPWLACQQPVFLDRGLFDGEAYYINDGMEVPPDFEQLPASRYALALLIEELPFFDNNGVRWEDIEFTRRITPIIADCYRRRGIKVAHIPALPPEQRVRHVLDIVQRHLPQVNWAAPHAVPALV